MVIVTAAMIVIEAVNTVHDNALLVVIREFVLKK
jgi:hypothetical protein